MSKDETVRRRLVEAAESVTGTPPPTTEVISAKRRALRWSVIAATTAGVAAAAVLSYASFFTASAVRPFNVPFVPDEAVVPHVTGQRLDDATSELDEAGLESEVRRRCDPKAKRCLVRRQNPAAGTQVKPGTTVVLTLAAQSGRKRNGTDEADPAPGNKCSRTPKPPECPGQTGDGGREPPPPANPCRDRKDNDHDGLVDTKDPGCTGDKTEEPRTMKPHECVDRKDNDDDGLVDAKDPGCTDDNTEEDNPPPECADGKDNDDDGLVDTKDPGCTDDNTEEQDDLLHECADRKDNDDDGRVDTKDPGCTDDNTEEEDEPPPPVTSTTE
jgi:hypothetical protein